MWKKLIRRYRIGEENENNLDNAEINNNDKMGSFDIYMGPESSSSQSTNNKSNFISSSVTSSSASSQENHTSFKKSQIKSIKEWGRRKSANFSHLASSSSNHNNTQSNQKSSKQHNSDKIDEIPVITSTSSASCAVNNTNNVVPCGTDVNNLPGNYLSSRMMTADSENKIQLEVLLKDAKFFELFNNFLKGEWSDENLEFWSEVEKLKRERSESKQDKRVGEIWDRFIQAGSEREVSFE